MRKIAVIGMVLVLMFAMTGCGSNDITLTEEQNSSISDYVAGVLVKYSYSNEWNYEKLKMAERQASVSATSSSSAATGKTTSATAGTTTGSTSGGAAATGSSTAVSNADPAKALADALKLSGATVSYSQYSVGGTYPTGDFMISVPADSGCKVVAVEFTIHNTTSSDITANTKSSGVTMKLTVNGTPVPESMTILSSDISNLNNVSIAPGSSYTAAAIFQVSDGLTDNISSMSLSVYAGTTALGTIPIK